jgi:hypothetical protein
VVTLATKTSHQRKKRQKKAAAPAKDAKGKKGAPAGNAPAEEEAKPNEDEI